MINLNRRSALLLLSTLLLAAPALLEATAKEKSSASSALTAAEVSFRCEKIHKSTLVALKKEMVQLCNLNRPYSIAATDNLFSREYVFCCWLGGQQPVSEETPASE